MNKIGKHALFFGVCLKGFIVLMVGIGGLVFDLAALCISQFFWDIVHHCSAERAQKNKKGGGTKLTRT